VDKVPFSAYDFFGYVIPGTVVLFGSYLLFGSPDVMGRNLTVAEGALLLLAVFLLGHLIATPAQWVLETILVGRFLGAPHVRLLSGGAQPAKLRFLFPKYYTPLPEAVRARLSARAEAEGAGSGEALFLHIRYANATLANSMLMQRLDYFVSAYGFARNTGFACLALGFALAVKAGLGHPVPTHSPLLALGCGMLLVLRYLKTFRQYTYELFNTVRGLRRRRSSGYELRFTIFDVEHGFCAYLVADTGNVMLFDCGHNVGTGFQPADYLVGGGYTAIERFFCLNYDEDHLSGLPRLRAFKDKLPVTLLHRNETISVDTLRSLKSAGGPIGPGVAAMLVMAEEYSMPPTPPGPDFSPLTFTTFHNNYPEFQDTNNLTLAVLLKHPDLTVFLSGDLERTGWRRLLLRQAFQDALRGVDVFVASHHGRESGYAREVFDYCAPDVVVISDDEIQFETQEHGYYDQHATGIRFDDGTTRRVLTTRRDGSIRFATDGRGSYRVTLGAA